MTQISTVVFDVGRVLFEWDLRHLFAKLIPDSEELDWFLAHVVTPEWHFQHDAGRPLADMTAELTTQYPHYGPLIEAYRTRFNETIPGPVPGSLDIVHDLAAQDVPLFAITNFGAEFWDMFRPTQPIFDHFATSSFPGSKNSRNLIRQFMRSLWNALACSRVKQSSSTTIMPMSSARGPTALPRIISPMPARFAVELVSFGLLQ